MCVLCVCVLVVLFHFLCLSSLSIHSLSPSVHNYSLFLSLQEQHWWKRWAVSPSIHPLLIHSLVIQLLLSLSSPSMFSICGLTGLLGTLYLLFLTIAGLETFTGLLEDSSTTETVLSYNCWIGDLHWTSWGLFNYRDCSFLQLLDWRPSLDFLRTFQLQRLSYFKLFLFLVFIYFFITVFLYNFLVLLLYLLIVFKKSFFYLNLSKVNLNFSFKDNYFKLIIIIITLTFFHKNWISLELNFFWNFNTSF